MAKSSSSAIAPNPMSDRYKSRRTWEEFVVQEVPKEIYPTMHEVYLGKAKAVN